MRKVLGEKISRVLSAYYRGPDHPTKLRLWGWLRQLTRYPRLTIPYGNGGWITVDERDLLQREVFVTGSYESEVWDALSTFATEEEVVWDVGAHIGSFSIRALLDSRVKQVHAFEPDPLLADVLTINVSLNRGHCVIHRLALDSEERRLKLYHGPSANTGLSALMTPLGHGVFEVECQRVDDLVFRKGLPAPTLLKIDVEGWEFHVLKGAQRILSERPPKAIVFEAPWPESGGNLQAFLRKELESFGYTIQHISRPSNVVEGRENFLAVPNGVSPWKLAQATRAENLP